MINKEIDIHIKKSLQALPINDELAAFKITIQTIFPQSQTSQTIEGIGYIKDLNAWDGQKESLHNRYVLVQNEFVENYKKYGMPGNLFKDKGWDYENFNSYMSDTPFTDMEKNDLENKQFVKFLSSDHSLTLLDKTIVSKPIHFDYICAGIDNEKYDLEKLAEILSKSNDILFIKKDELFESPLSDKDCQGLIQDIPGYNATEEAYETINFIARLKQQDYEAMSQSVNMNSTFEIYGYIAKYDLLGIEEARIKHSLVQEVEPIRNKFR